MRVELIRNNDNKVVGYKIIRESVDDLRTIEHIRDMYFWGHLGKIKYDGRVSDKETDETMQISFVSEDYQKQQDEERTLRHKRRCLIYDHLHKNSPLNIEELVKLTDDELNVVANTYNYNSQTH